MNRRHLLGQHFLKSASIAKSIVDLAKIGKDDVVLEVGTGKGILTSRLCEKAKLVISIEKDLDLYLEARKRFSRVPNLVLEHGDAFEKNFDFTLFVSNLPYSESRAAIEWLIQRRFVRGMVMVQKEFAQKLLENEGNEKRAVAVLAKYCMQMEKLMDINKNNFDPPPKVDSVLLALCPKRMVPLDVIRTVNRIFSFKRKTLRNIAKQFGMSVDSDRRLEDLTETEIVDIATKIV